MEKRVSVSISGGVADVRLVRADKMNALDAAMFDALVATSARLAREEGVRAVVLSGEGRAFCAGLDMGRFAAMKEKGGNGVAGGEKRDLSVRTHGLANFPQQAVWGWRQLPVPVIAAIQGVAFGGGFQLALGADMRFLSPDARMSIMEIKWGLVPDMAGTPILASLVRDDILRELTYTGRIFSAQEAMAYGLATRICDDPRADAFEVAREIAGKSPDAIRAAKRLLNKLSVDPGPALNPSSSRSCSAVPIRPKPCAPISTSARRALRMRDSGAARAGRVQPGFRLTFPRHHQRRSPANPCRRRRSR
jgi:enoyl-CoA hydratase/carnithine racemase